MREESIFLRNTFIIIRFGKYFDKFNPVPLKNENPPCQNGQRLGGQRSSFFFSLSSSRDHFSLGHVLNSRGRTKSHTFPPAGRHLVAGQNRHEYVMLVTYCFHRVFRQAGIVARRGGGGGKKGIFDLFEQTSFLPHSILLHSLKFEVIIRRSNRNSMAFDMVSRLTDKERSVRKG